MLTTGVCRCCDGIGCGDCRWKGELVRCTSCYDWVPIGDGVHSFPDALDEEFICRSCLGKCMECGATNAVTHSALKWDQERPIFLRTASLVRLCSDCVCTLLKAGELVGGTLHLLTDTQKGK